MLPTGGRFDRFGRDDIVLRKGRYCLVHGHMTPYESMVEDLLAIADALEAAGIPFLLVRDDEGREIVAVDRARREELAAVLAHERAHLRHRHDLVLEFFTVLHTAAPPRLRSAAALGYDAE